ncbi:MAG: PRD domain-containing protein [Collinsella aerofaciens]
MLEDVIEILESDFRIIVDRDSFDFTRFATHLRYLFGAFAGESLNSANMQMYKNFHEEFPQLAECVKHIGSYCRETGRHVFSEERGIHLMIHLNRIISKKDCNP